MELVGHPPVIGTQDADVDRAISLMSAHKFCNGIRDSGYGTEGGAEAIEAYLDTRFVSRMPQIT